MGQALYRKYRSKSLGDIVGQDAVMAALGNAIKTGKFSHAYLFTGPRGVGKTSVARILAHLVNDLEYTSDQLPIDIIEIDAASNRRIDEIRDLREKVMIAPVSSKYKVYIIDEVHMLTREAFNALLKTLEEPPAHVIFILATTEAHKLPETIVSRTQKYSFKLASTKEIIKLLGSIAKKEKINIDQDALRILADHSGGSLRDAVSLLDQVRHTDSAIDSNSVQLSLGLPDQDLVTQIIEYIKSGDSAKLLNCLKGSFQNGTNANTLASLLIANIRQQILDNKLALDHKLALQLMQELLEVASGPQAETRLEIALMNYQLQVNEPKTATIASSSHISPPLTISEPVSRKKLKAEEPTTATTSPNTDSQPLSQEIWLTALQQIKNKHSTLYSFLNSAQSQINGNQITVNFKHAFHAKRASDSNNKQILLNALSELGVADCSINYEHHKPTAIKKEQPTTPHSTNKVTAVDNVAAVFGGAEVIE